MTKLGYRKSIIEHLEVISDPAKQRRVGPFEIINGWFDDLYVPADDPNLYNHGVFEKGLEEFESCFTEDEIKALESFHEYFNSIVDDINTDLPFETIQKDQKWIDLGKEALRALRIFEQHPTMQMKLT